MYVMNFVLNLSWTAHLILWDIALTEAQNDLKI